MNALGSGFDDETTKVVQLTICVPFKDERKPAVRA